MVKLLFLKRIKNKLRTIEAQIVQKLKNDEPRPKFTGSYKKQEAVRTAYNRVRVANSSPHRLLCCQQGCRDVAVVSTPD